LVKVMFAHLSRVAKFAASGAGATQVVFEGRVSRPGNGQAPQSLLQLAQVSPVSQVPSPQLAQMPPSLAQGVVPPCAVVVVSFSASIESRPTDSVTLSGLLTVAPLASSELVLAS
jgi:hypothetical protein